MEKYKPSKEEFKKAEGMMTAQEKEMSRKREEGREKIKELTNSITEEFFDHTLKEIFNMSPKERLGYLTDQNLGDFSRLVSEIEKDTSMYGYSSGRFEKLWDSIHELNKEDLADFSNDLINILDKLQELHDEAMVSDTPKTSEEVVEEKLKIDLLNKIKNLDFTKVKKPELLYLYESLKRLSVLIHQGIDPILFYYNDNKSGPFKSEELIRSNINKIIEVLGIIEDVKAGVSNGKLLEYNQYKF